MLNSAELGRSLPDAMKAGQPAKNVSSHDGEMNENTAAAGTNLAPVLVKFALSISFE